MKKFFLSPLIRISFSLTLLTVSMLLISDLLGLIPDTRHAELQSRKFAAESLAVQLSNEITRKQLEGVDHILQSIVARNEFITSAAVRKKGGELVSEFGGHEQYWTLQSGDKSTATQVLVPLFNGQDRWGNVELTFTDLNGNGGLFSLRNSFLGILLFISLGGFLVYLLFLKRALRELNPDAVIPERVSKALDTLSEGLLIVDQKGFVVFANLAFAKKMGLKPQELLGKDIAGFGWGSPGEGGDRLNLPWADVLTGQTLSRSATLTLTNGLNEVCILNVNVSPITATEGKVRGVLITFDDITQIEAKNEALHRTLQKLERSQKEISRQNQELQWLAARDPLTGVLNRRSLTHHMDLLFDEAREEGGEFSCIMVDIDHFKSVNDRFGHGVGDETIKLVTQILTECSRSGDLVGRLGGEEFVVILPETDVNAAARIAERMRSAIEGADTATIHSDLRITSSFGIAALLDGAASAPDLLAQADKALYVAKETGRNRVICWSRTMASDPSLELAHEQDSVVSALPVIDSKPAVQLPAKKSGAEAKLGRDSAAGRPSDALLQDRIEQGINRARRDGTHIAVLVVNVDSLQRVKDTLGFALAEKLAKKIIACLKQTLRSTDTVAVCEQEGLLFTVSRLDGNEIALVLTDLERPEIVTKILQRIFLAFKTSISVESNEFYLNVNLGVSLFPRDGADAEILLRNAGSAMREGKRAQGDNSFWFYADEINQSAKKQIQLEAELHRAIERNELTVYYQPKIDLRTGEINSMEALVRWQHPISGLVQPGEFIPLAEQAGLIEELDRWVIRAVCQQISFWQKSGYGTVPVAVNLSPFEFRNPNLAEEIIAVVEEFDIPAEALEIEITETAVMHCLDAATGILEKLGAAGIRFYLDDFGTGYSSISYLKRFPISVVKIDRTFITDFLKNSSDASIVSAIIAMSHSLGIRVVAEGVETEEQLRFLQDLHCDEVQGYLMSKPLPKEQITELLAHASNIRQKVLEYGAEYRRLRDVQGSAPAMIGIVNAFPEKIRADLPAK
ncbi:EAL domain-containing protein [Marinobacter sediminum]|uniref:sensor domain-containing protein n=1 Tax=Marinobacter sediminum TaxID=256323 RepID=UPI00193ABB86|nr:EAL domain-containing protein [Marinobacter sediminum]